MSCRLRRLLTLLLIVGAVPARAQTRTEAGPPHAARHEPARTPHHEPAARHEHPPQHTAPHHAPVHHAAPHAQHPAAPHHAAPAPAPAPAAAPPPAAPPANVGSNTGLPIPRFASLRSDDVNLRVGPGTRYPIEWVYKRRYLPVEVEREFDIWRLVVDSDGVRGWVHQATLEGRRTVVVTGGQRLLRAGPSETAAAVARLEPGVILRVRSCAAGSDWCSLQVGDYHGYMRRDEVWGLLPGEVIQ